MRDHGISIYIRMYTDVYNNNSMDQPISIPPTTTPPDNSLVYFYQCKLSISISDVMMM